MVQDEIRHPALTGGLWPVISIRIRREDQRLRAASWRPAPQAIPEDVLLPCAWRELEGLTEVAVGLSRSRIYVRELAEHELAGRLVLCLRGAPGAIQVQGPMAPVGEVLAARTRSAVLHVAAVHHAADREEDRQVWRARARQLLKASRAARRGRSVRATSAGLPTLGGRS
ncbi:hypothetical protein E5082_31460 [Streptomyces griseoluteus]|uniref:Uncharacterized protein n=1 Tax=Streptomyces griseoluteus TaxID=29306 RepID=A0A4Z1CXC9_STRGP|nr:hypothetical protein [Streptomyces griseoluteus]TGN73535.1 hypothetical protein E5082_31460 [Streptomyces griseoluteus]